MTTPIVVVGVPSALGGNLPANPEAARGMARAPAELRRLGPVSYTHLTLPTN